jgi:hypothetical protein
MKSPLSNLVVFTSESEIPHTDEEGIFRYFFSEGTAVEN